MRNVLPLNDGVYKISIIKPTHSHHLCHTKVHSSHFPLFLKTTPFNKFIYSKTFDLAWVSIISLCLFQWLCFLLEHILRNFKLFMYDIMFGKNFVHALFVCHDYWANHPHTLCRPHVWKFKIPLAFYGNVGSFIQKL